MTDTTPATAVARVWAQQRIWSRTSNLLRARIDQARQTGLALAIATAVLAVLAGQVASAAPGLGRLLQTAAAVAAGLGTLIGRRTQLERITEWTRARSVSEGLKSEVFQRLAGGTTYEAPEPDRILGERCRAILAGVGDLQRHALGISADGKPLPAVHDLSSYIGERVNEQIDHYYRPRAESYERRVRRLRTAVAGLGIAAVVFSAVGAIYQLSGVAAWVPVLTTVTTALLAHISASHYDDQVVQFLRCAQQLEQLRDGFADDRSTAAGSAPRGLTPAQFIDACESILSVQNQSWMARWITPEKKA